MRHNRKKATLGRTAAQRNALMRNLAESLVLYGSIRTTKAKAKALRPLVEKLITKAGRASMSDRTSIKKVLYTKNSITKLINELGPKYKERSGGYTRITALGHRSSDGADMARIELV